MKLLPLLTLALCTAGLIQAAQGAGSDKFVLPDPVAVVEGKEIKAADAEKMLNNVLQRSGKQLADLTGEEKMQAARSVVDTLITQEIVAARSNSVKVTDEELDAYFQQFAKQFPDQTKLEEQLKASGMTVAQAKEQMRISLRERKWMDEQVAGKVIVSDSDAREFFAANPKYFDVPDMVRASHILIRVPEDASTEVVAEKEKAIRAAAARIDKGEDFAKVAKEVSEDPGSKEMGGDLNFFPKTAMVPEFTEAAFALKKDEVSKPLKTKIGFHLIKQTGRKDAYKMTFEEAQPKILMFLKEDKKKAALRDLFRELRAKADVKNNLPPAPEPKPEAKP